VTNTIALWLACIIIGFFVLDHFILHLDAVTHVMRGVLFLINKAAVWR